MPEFPPRDLSNLGALPVIEITVDDTEPEPFGTPNSSETARRCLNCGVELPIEDERAYYAGQVDAYLRMHAWLISNGINPVSAARMIEAARAQKQK